MKKKYIITKQSIVNKCATDGKDHRIFTEAERPCKEAVLTDIVDKMGQAQSRFMIEIEDNIEALDELCDNYGVDIKVSKNLFFPDLITLIMCDTD